MSDAGIVGTIGDWFAHPFKTEGNAVRWILFVGLLIIAAFFWQLILIDIFER